MNEWSAALYIRLSKEDERAGESESVTNQKSLLMHYAKENNIAVYDSYIDDGYSGTNFNRPAFCRMIDDIKSRKVNMVVTKDMSRLGRDYIDTGYYMEKFFPEKHVRYVSLLDGIDTMVENSVNDITPFRAVLNDLYAKDISKKILCVKHDKQKRGLFIGSQAPFGYRKADENCNKLVRDGKTAPIVQKIFSMAQVGSSAHEIAQILNENHIKSPAVYAGWQWEKSRPFSGLWSSEGVARILKNPTYIGTMVQAKSRKINYKSKHCERLPAEKWQVVPRMHEPLVSQVVFDQVQILLQRRTHQRTRQYDYALKGYLYCHECGCPLGVINRPRTDGSERLFLICRTYQRFTKLNKCTCHSIKEETVRMVVREQIERMCAPFLAFDGLLFRAQKWYEDNVRKEQDEKSLEHYLDHINRQIDHLYEDRTENLIAEDDFFRMYENLKIKKGQMIKKQKLVQNVERPSMEAWVLEFMSSFVFDKAFLSMFVEKIEYSEEKKLWIYLKVLAEKRLP